MASRKKTARKAPKKSTRRGESGGANPRNDGRITEEQHEEAMRVLRAEYYQGVRGIVAGLKDAIKDGEIKTEEDLERRIDEEVDGSYWVIYTHANFQVLMFSDNHDAYSEDFGEAPVSGDSIDWMRLAYAALRRDVTEQGHAEGLELPGGDLDEARRSGRDPRPPEGSGRDPATWFRRPVERGARKHEKRASRSPRGLRRGR